MSSHNETVDENQGSNLRLSMNVVNNMIRKSKMLVHSGGKQ